MPIKLEAKQIFSSTKKKHLDPQEKIDRYAKCRHNKAQAELKTIKTDIDAAAEELLSELQELALETNLSRQDLLVSAPDIASKILNLQKKVIQLNDFNDKYSLNSWSINKTRHTTSQTAMNEIQKHLAKIVALSLTVGTARHSDTRKENLQEITKSVQTITNNINILYNKVNNKLNLIISKHERDHLSSTMNRAKTLSTGIGTQLGLAQQWAEGKLNRARALKNQVLNHASLTEPDRELIKTLAKRYKMRAGVGKLRGVKPASTYKANELRNCKTIEEFMLKLKLSALEVYARRTEQDTTGANNIYESSIGWATMQTIKDLEKEEIFIPLKQKIEQINSNYFTEFNDTYRQDTTCFMKQIHRLRQLRTPTPEPHPNEPE